ncbi:DUF2066 domain-containing protein [Hahella ganghwensis]|uniref:DUF2066 domain-containing protein n=1 Tax=Hahella ganghwensis TaxID=286420 RepID=UPI000379F272|nr:DUF2066 domain-containing protein [Hahella ganghwensis]
MLEAKVTTLFIQKLSTPFYSWLSRVSMSTRKAWRGTLAVLLVGCLFQTHAFAVPVRGLYEAHIPVADQSSDARQEALNAALEQVVDRVTGTPYWRDVYSPADLVSNSQRLLEQYSYSRNDRPSDGLPWIFNAKFSGSALAQLLARQGLPVWGQSRPQTLFWIALDERGVRDVVAEPQERPMVEYLQSAARHWGLPILLPLMDLEDSATLNVSDLWGFFAGPVEAASTRYSSDAVVMARVYQDNAGRWTGRWQLRVNGQSLSQGEIEAQGQEEWAQTLMAEVASAQAKKYAITLDESAANLVKLEVTNVTSFRDYVDVSRMLQKLAPVKRVEPFFMSRDVVRFELSLNSVPEQLEEHIALQEKLRPVLGDGGQEEIGYWLYYQWGGSQ